MKKPNLILHIGHSKTGTTSIQDFLAKNTAELIKLGYYYPTVYSPRNNHVLLQAGFIDTQDLRVRRHQVYAGDKKWFQQDFQRFWKSLHKEINRHKPHTVIFSAEQMFRDFSEKSKIGLAGFLSQYFDQVVVVCYIRSPVAYFISSISQKIKTGVDGLDIRHRPLRKYIEYYEGQFPGHIELHAFERSQLIDGDVLTDFLTKYIPGAVALLEKERPAASNASLPWPLLRALREVRMQVQPEGKEPLMETRMLLALLTRNYRKKHKFALPGKVEISPTAKHLLTQSAVDYLWLRDKYGVAFSDLDYEYIDPDFTLEDEHHGPVTLDNIIDFSNMEEVKLETRWYKRKGLAFYLFYFIFILRLRIKRIYYVYIRNLHPRFIGSR